MLSCCGMLTLVVRLTCCHARAAPPPTTAMRLAFKRIEPTKR